MGRKRVVKRRRLPPVENWRSVSYLDTIVLTMPRLMPREAFRALRASLATELRPRGGRFVLKLHRYGNTGFFFNLHIHQPTTESLRVLSRLGACGRITQAHVALDLVVADAGRAEKLRRHLEARLCVSDRPRLPSIEVRETTTYFNRHHRAGIEVAIYADRLSKLALEPCCHLEWRIKGAAKLRQYRLGRPEDIAKLDPRAFWSGVLRLSRPPTVEQLVEVRRKVLRQRLSAEDGVRRDVVSALRLVTGPTGLVSSHNLRCWQREVPALFERRAHRLFVEESTTWMLPENKSIVW